MAMLGSGSQFDDAIKMLWRDDTSSAEDATWSHVTDLLEDPWLRRAWIMQEAVASRSVKLVCGGCAVDWDDLFSRAPNDDRQQEAEDLIEFADLHPSADVLGVDLSPIQPTFVPPNCRFEVDDINQEWSHPDNHFDFVHIRAMMGCIPDWTELFEKAFKHTLPGGWVESVELWGAAKCDDDTLKSDSPLYTWIDIFKSIGSLTGKPFFWDDKMAESIKKAGFINLTGRVIKVPIGTWPKDKTLKQWGA
ncbi:Hypothetical protein NCS54_01511000 [Fusarium falciforme]|uniref:Hypothetical protein n=1 Tax=Fusarium falciforme TaxID=195108 RepID=UPI002300D8E2|nr:Hypothetical protein NCS54_01511000 [Fusarium falciforme]WAO97385.1 Hypothetical protein NCS54_01511000 [Fusarium falciforme]